MECMQSVLMKHKKAWFLILVAGRMVVAIDWKDSKDVAITTLEISVFTQMVHGVRWKSIAIKKTLVTIQMGVSFVWNPFLLGECQLWISPHRSCRWREIKEKKKEMNAWSVHYKLFLLFDRDWLLNLCSFAVHHV